jgi:hypothetical protein
VVDKTVQLFGQPIATVRDMGDGCASAVESLRRAGVPDLVCHYHFLAAVGKCLFKPLYDRIRALLRESRCRPEMHALLRDLRKYSCSDKTQGRYGEGTVRDALKALVLWVLEGDGRSDAPFPFSLPHLEFARRCLEGPRKAEPWVCRPRSQPERRALDYLECLVARLESAPRFAATVKELDTRWAAFCELRDVLRLCNAELPRGDVRGLQHHLPALELLRIQQIKEAVDQYTTDLEGRIRAKEKRAKQPDSVAAIILRYLRQYGPYLFGHPAKLDEDGRVVAVVERTNNVAEHFFGRHKQQLRRRVGRGQLGRDLEKQPAQVALVSNLRDPEYVRLLAGSLDQLPATFAWLDQETSVKLPMLVRNHRDSQLHRVLRDLQQDTVEAPSCAEGAHKLHPPAASQVAASAQTLRELPSDEIRKSATPVVGQRVETPVPPRDMRLPPPGSVLERWYAGRAYHVEVAEDALRWRGNAYSTPTEVARAISKAAPNGFEFFGLTLPWNERAPLIRGRRINRTTLIDLPAAPTEF